MQALGPLPSIASLTARLNVGVRISERLRAEKTTQKKCMRNFTQIALYQSKGSADIQ